MYNNVFIDNGYSIVWAAYNITHANMLFYPLSYDIISLKSLKITQAFHLLLDFAENSIVSWYFKIHNSVWITQGSDNGDSDNRGSTIYTGIHIFTSSFIKCEIDHPHLFPRSS